MALRGSTSAQTHWYLHDVLLELTIVRQQQGLSHVRMHMHAPKFKIPRNEMFRRAAGQPVHASSAHATG